MPGHKRSEVWLADLNPRFGTWAGKTRPVLVVQRNVLNAVHPSTIVCPVTSKITPESELLRVRVPKGKAGLEKDSDIMIDQLRAIDNKRLLRKLGALPKDLSEHVKENLIAVLGLDL